jgi:hypothetical protein
MIDLNIYIEPEVKAGVSTKLDKCPFRHILPYLSMNGGEIEQIIVADNGQDLAELGAFCVGAIDGIDYAGIISELRESGRVKMVIQGQIAPEMYKYGWSIGDINPQEAIECFFAPPLYVIRFLNFIWS